MKPSISHGLGALTPSTWQQLYKTVAESGNNIHEPTSVVMDRFTARITGSSGTNNKYIYSWRRNRQSAGGTTNEWTDGEEIGGTGANDYSRAINILEGGNTQAIAYGYAVNANGDLANANGFRVSPVPTGTVVIMNALRGLNGVISFQFAAPNPITGACPAAIASVGMDEGTYPLPS